MADSPHSKKIVFSINGTIKVVEGVICYENRWHGNISSHYFEVEFCRRECLNGKTEQGKDVERRAGSQQEYGEHARWRVEGSDSSVLRARAVQNIAVGFATTGTSYLRLLPFGFTCFGSWGSCIPWNFLSPGWWLEVDEVMPKVYCSVQWEKRKKTKPLVVRITQRYRA